MALAAKGSSLKLSGAATAMVGEATTSLGGSVYQITNSAKRAVSPAAAVVVKDAGVPVSSSLWSFDYLFGKVTFSGYAPGGAVTVDANYLPIISAQEIRDVSFTASRDLLDDTVYGDSARSKLPALKDLSGSAVSLAHVSTDLDVGAGGEQSWRAFFTDGTPKLLEFHPETSGDFFRAWVMIEGFDESAAFDGLVEVSFDFSGANQPGVTDGDGAAFGWGS